jgi:hypothetical protein
MREVRAHKVHGNDEDRTVLFDVPEGNHQKIAREAKIVPSES